MPALSADRAVADHYVRIPPARKSSESLNISQLAFYTKPLKGFKTLIWVLRKLRQERNNNGNNAIALHRK
jgi:hypothetical protein